MIPDGKDHLIRALETYIFENTSACQCGICGAEESEPCEPSCIVEAARALLQRLEASL